MSLSLSLSSVKGRRGVLTHPGLSWRHVIKQQPESSIWSIEHFLTDGQLLASPTNLDPWSWAWRRKATVISHYSLHYSSDTWTTQKKKKKKKDKNLCETCGPCAAIRLPHSQCTNNHADSMEHESLAWGLPRGPRDAASHLSEAHMWVSAGPRPLRTAVTVSGICLPTSLSCHISDTWPGGQEALLGSLDRTQLLWLFHKDCPVSTSTSSPTVLFAPFLYLGVTSRHHCFAAVPFQP